MEAIYLNNFRIALPVASLVNGPALPHTDYKVGTEIQSDDSVDVTGGGGSKRSLFVALAFTIESPTTLLRVSNPVMSSFRDFTSCSNRVLLWKAVDLAHILSTEEPRGPVRLSRELSLVPTAKIKYYPGE